MACSCFYKKLNFQNCKMTDLSEFVECVREAPKISVLLMFFFMNFLVSVIKSPIAVNRSFCNLSTSPLVHYIVPKLYVWVVLGSK